MVTKDLGMVTAYAYAVAGGYTGTEAEFTQLMADLAVVVDDFDNFSVNVTTLPAGSSATASYADGVLSLGIPKGDKGDKGNTGDTGSPAGFGTVSATVDANIGTPSVEVTASGADTAKNFAFAFHNLKGQKGDKGDTGEVSEAELAEALEDFAENGTVANAEQLTTKIRTNDQTPYLFRTSGGSVDIGDREYINGIVGGTVAWNQLVQNGDFSDGTTSWLLQNCTATVSGNKMTITATTEQPYIQQAVSVIANHKYLMSLKFGADASNAEDEVPLIVINWQSGGYKGFSAVPKGSTVELACVLSSATNDNRINAYASTNATVGDKYTFENVQTIDLTLALGSTIADYIYSLEQANAGAGVAFFKSLFPKPYYAYNAGELKSVKGLVSHDMVGFNAWDEETQRGYISASDGSITVKGNGNLISKNYIPVLPDTTYYFKCGSMNNSNVRTCFYDANKNYIGYVQKNGNPVTFNNPFTTPVNAYYMLFELQDGYGFVYNHDICINLSWDGERDGEYEEYVEHVYELDSDLELRGIPKLSAGNDLYYDGDVYEPDGTVTRKYGVVDLGTLTWQLNTGNQFFSNVPNFTESTWGINHVCSKYVASARGAYDGAIDKSISLSQSYIWIIDSGYTSVTEFKNSLSGVYLVYELATPTTETADPYTNPQIVDDFGTEEFVISNTIAVPIPVGHNTDYPIDLKAKVEMMPNSPGGDGDYIVRQTNGTNEYVALANNATIQDILARLEALEG